MCKGVKRCEKNIEDAAMPVTHWSELFWMHLNATLSLRTETPRICLPVAVILLVGRFLIAHIYTSDPDVLNTLQQLCAILGWSFEVRCSNLVHCNDFVLNSDACAERLEHANFERYLFASRFVYVYMYIYIVVKSVIRIFVGRDALYIPLLLLERCLPALWRPPDCAGKWSDWTWHAKGCQSSEVADDAFGQTWWSLCPLEVKLSTYGSSKLLVDSHVSTTWHLVCWPLAEA